MDILKVAGSEDNQKKAVRELVRRFFNFNAQFAKDKKYKDALSKALTASGLIVVGALLDYFETADKELKLKVDKSKKREEITQYWNLQDNMLEQMYDELVEMGKGESGAYGKTASKSVVSKRVKAYGVGFYDVTELDLKFGGLRTKAFLDNKDVWLYVYDFRGKTEGIIVLDIWQSDLKSRIEKDLPVLLKKNGISFDSSDLKWSPAQVTAKDDYITAYRRVTLEFPSKGDAKKAFEKLQTLK